MGQVSILEDILKLQDSLDHWRRSAEDESSSPPRGDAAVNEIRALVELLADRLDKLWEIANHPELDRAAEINRLANRVRELEQALDEAKLSRIVAKPSLDAIERLTSENIKLRGAKRLSREREEDLKRQLTVQKQRYANLARTGGVILKPTSRR